MHEDDTHVRGKRGEERGERKEKRLEGRERPPVHHETCETSKLHRLGFRFRVWTPTNRRHEEKTIQARGINSPAFERRR
jgi:hypothetical protein